MSNTKKNKKTIVEIDLYLEENRKPIQYKGRLLGLINDTEFNSLIKSRNLQNKFFTSSTLSLSILGKNYSDLKGLRLVVAIKNKQTPKRLFTSEKLSLISSMKIEGNHCELGIVTDDNNWMLIKERRE